MRKTLPLLVILSLVLGLLGPSFATPVHAQADFPVPGGHFYTQASPQGAAGFGYRVTDEGGIPFFSTYKSLGGPEVLGYPISKRFVWQGFVHQAMQKAILQWQPQGASGQLTFVNIFDELTKAGKDGWLLVVRSTPNPLPQSGNVAAEPFDAIVKTRLALLDSRPAIRDRFFAAANAIDPVLLYGLPTSSVQDMGSHYAIRLQRAVLQEWKEDTVWAHAGEVTVANGGDIALESGILPPIALIPEPPSTNNTPDLPTLSPDAESVAAAAKPATVKITLANGDFGTGMIITPDGRILTAAHVVETARRATVQLPDGRTFEGRVLGRDQEADVAVLKIEASGLPTLRLGNSDTLQLGDPVVALGYSPIVPQPPSARIGTVRDLVGDPTLGGGELYDVIGSDTFIHPGDSGGPLLNLRGEVVGMNTSILITDSPNRVLEASSMSINTVRSVMNQFE